MVISGAMPLFEGLTGNTDRAGRATPEFLESIPTGPGYPRSVDASTRGGSPPDRPKRPNKGSRKGIGDRHRPRCCFTDADG